MNNMAPVNRLKDEKSLYLLQHKDNPVAWWPFNDEAIAEAKRLNRPIFLSIGYSSCHWCHVMAHESFEDEQTAKFLNDSFINIKVDREELPDVDQYYQEVCQLFNRPGGWPLSVFLLPTTDPFFVGTYFPKFPAHGLPSFKQLATDILRAYNERRSEIDQDTLKIKQAILKGPQLKDPPEIQENLPHANSILDALDRYLDKDFGGYGQAPKFPHFSFHEWAVEQCLEGQVEQNNLDHIIKSLEKMLMGGIYDHARGGIHRYSTDEKWIVPHFEKMLYDQAGLLKTISKASLVAPIPLFLDVLFDTLDYLEKEMVSDHHYFFTAQDADSEGQEGIFFTFTQEEFLSALENKALDGSEIQDWFNITKEGNFESALNVITLNEVKKKEFYTESGWNKIRKVKQALVTARKERIPPATDSKGLASWNFFLISALCDVVQYCPVFPIKKKALQLLDQTLPSIFELFVKEGPDGLELRRSTTQTNSLLYFEDYSFFVEACLRVYEISGVEKFKDYLKKGMKTIFQDFVENDHLLTRSKKSSSSVPYPNLTVGLFDQSFRSPVSTFLNVARRSKALLGEDYGPSDLAELIKKSHQLCLMNPLSCGEALRALTYPQQIYRKLEVPKSWAQSEEFLNFTSFLPGRFVISYQTNDQESWQVCSFSSCDLQGKGLKDCIQKMQPPKASEQTLP